MRGIEVHDAQLGRLPVRWRSAPAPAEPDVPTLWLHGVPHSSEMWTPFLERAGGIAPDLPGFGRTGKPAEHPYTIAGYARFVEDFVDHLELERVSLAMHDWGSVGLAFAQAHPERVERLVLINVVPFLPGYRWHRIARIWRTRGLGELSMGFTAPWNLRHASGLPPAMVDEVFEHFDQGTQRAILRLYRSAGPDELAAAGRGLREVTAPALVLWGDRDPYLPARFADGLAAALGDAAVRHLPGAGHWPWLDAPGVIELTASFVSP